MEVAAEGVRKGTVERVEVQYRADLSECFPQSNHVYSR